GSIDGHYFVPMQELDDYEIYRHCYYHNPYCQAVKDLSWRKVVNGDYGDRCSIIGFQVKKKGMIALYNLHGECVVPLGAKQARAIFQRETLKCNYYKAEYEDNTVAVYDKHGKEIIAPHQYNSIQCFGEEYRDDDKPYGIRVSLTIDDDTEAEALFDYDGNEIIPFLLGCRIRGREGEFVVYPPIQPHEDVDSYIEYGYKKYTAGAFAKYRYHPAVQTTRASSCGSEPQHRHSMESQPYQPEYGMRDVWRPCNDCNGNGECRYCHGKGWDYVTNGSGQIISSQQCIICNGTGRCQTCYGSRGHYEKEQYQIR
ncbi:MAG: hypothetical protein K2L49_04775, partial [Muribaculaceae bacterium]|nr:hypothetical protein [Muribaculaceae bacterium]